MTECELCGARVQTNYLSLCLCSACSDFHSRCLVCGDVSMPHLDLSSIMSSIAGDLHVPRNTAHTPRPGPRCESSRPTQSCPPKEISAADDTDGPVSPSMSARVLPTSKLNTRPTIDAASHAAVHGAPRPKTGRGPGRYFSSVSGRHGPAQRQWRSQGLQGPHAPAPDTRSLSTISQGRAEAGSEARRRCAADNLRRSQLVWGPVPASGMLSSQPRDRQSLLRSGERMEVVQMLSEHDQAPGGSPARSPLHSLGQRSGASPRTPPKSPLVPQRRPGLNELHDAPHQSSFGREDSDAWLSRLDSGWAPLEAFMDSVDVSILQQSVTCRKVGTDV